MSTFGGPAAVHSSPVAVLLIDDDYDNHVIMAGLLALSDLHVTVDWQPTYARGLEVLEDGRCDVCLLNCDQGAQTAVAFLQSFTAAGVATPVILLTDGPLRPDDAAAFRAAGADYLARDELTAESLTRVIRYTTERQRARTAHLELERQLRQAQRLEAVGRLSGGIAHDINNVLNVIIANVDLLRTTGIERDDVAEALSEMGNVAHRGAALVRKLLAYGRRDALEMRTMNLAPVVTDVVRMLARVLPETVEVRASTLEDPLTVCADPGAINQMLLNIATNAKDAMPDGGRLDVTMGKTYLEPSFCALHPGSRVGNHVALSVSDTGCGMDAETLDQVFEPFFTTKPHGIGTGLGLAMVYGLTKQMGGYVQVSSKPGVGTTVTIYLPHETKRTVELPKVTAPKEEHPGGETVLFVEDQLELRRAGRKILERAGYRVIAAHDGREALRQYETHGGRIDIVVTDLVMPNIGGRELYEQLSSTRHPPRFLFMSGYSAKHIGNQLLEDNMPLLRKPWTLDDLLQAVREVLDLNRDPGAGRRFQRLHEPLGPGDASRSPTRRPTGRHRRPPDP